MREDGFRSFLLKRLDPRSVQSYVAYVRRVERELGSDVEACDLSETGISDVRDRLLALGLNEASARNSASSLRAYAAFAGFRPPALADRVVQAEPARPERRAAIRDAPVAALLVQYAEIMDELRDRRIVRTGNAPVGRFAEHLFAKAFGWTLEANSHAGHDAVDAAGLRYQIKSRRLTPQNPSRQAPSADSTRTGSTGWPRSCSGVPSRSCAPRSCLTPSWRRPRGGRSTPTAGSSCSTIGCSPGRTCAT